LRRDPLPRRPDLRDARVLRRVALRALPRPPSRAAAFQETLAVHLHTRRVPAAFGLQFRAANTCSAQAPERPALASAARTTVAVTGRTGAAKLPVDLVRSRILRIAARRSARCRRLRPPAEPALHPGASAPE